MSIPPNPSSGSPGLRIELGERVWVPHVACRWTMSRAGGPGGQHVNTTASKVILHIPVAAIVGLNAVQRGRLRTLSGDRLTQADEIVLQAGNERSQARNRALILRRLRRLVAQAQAVPKARKPTRPTKGSKERRLEGKKQAGAKKARRRERYD